MATKETLGIYELRWDRVYAEDGVSGAWRLWRRKPTRFAMHDFSYATGWTKKEAIQAAALYVSSWSPSQLLIYNRNGRIGKGRNAERSYKADSRRRKG